MGLDAQVSAVTYERMSGRRQARGLVAIAVIVLLVTVHQADRPAAQTVCGPKDVPSSLVRIDRGPLGSGTGVVIVRDDDYAIVLTAKHVLENPQPFSVVFQAAPQRPLPVAWTGETVFGFPTDGDIAVFRVDGAIPANITPEDPFLAGVSVRAAVTAWGYPVSRSGTLCSYSAPISDIASGRLVAGVYVPAGVSGGPVFLHDPTDGVPKLVGIVSGGDGVEQNGTTSAIDIRQADTIVSTSNDPRIGRPHVWPNISPRPTVDEDGRSFVRIDAGPFTMGSNDYDDEKPPHTLDLPVFYMARHEVTVGQFAECVKAGACTHSRPDLASRRTDHPVVGVSWDDAVAYTAWLRGHLASAKNATLRRLIQAGWQVDLPSEAEWEKSARHEGTGKFPWPGNGFRPANVNYETGQLRVVGQTKCADCTPPLADMAGNVREWTRSLKRPYPYVANQVENRADRGPRAVRGGSFRSQRPSTFGSAARASNRQDEQPTYADAYTGFRVALICLPARDCRWRDPGRR